MKLTLVAGAVVLAGALVLLLRHRWYWSRAMSDRWLLAQARRDARQGWDGPRWRLPAERNELAKQERLTQLRLARRTTWEERRDRQERA